MTIEAFVEKKIKNKKLAPEKLFRLLLRRGFDAEEIKRYMYENH
jgi:SOS response regulatory protein OraA/RecX